MSLKRLKPKYILLSTTTQPTQNLSTFTQENSLNFNCKSFDRLPSTIEPALPRDKHRPTEFKENTANKSFIHVKDDLNDCMQAMTVEQKKNNILKELNKIIQKKNRETEQTEKRVVKPTVERKQRKIRKEEYELEQILQRNNEEIARITGLREQVDSSRTDRVVFSALFKKIEREIKHYEKLYGDLIMKSEIKVISRAVNSETNQPELDPESLEQYEGKDETLHDYSRNDVSRFFMTLPEKIKKPINKRLSEGRKDTTTDIVMEIEQLEGMIEKIVKAAECSSCEETVSKYVELGNDNSTLIEEINEAQMDINDIQDEIERIKLERRNSLVTEERHMTKLTNLPSTRRLRSAKTIQSGRESHLITPHELIEVLSDTAGIRNSTMVGAMGEIEDVLIGHEGHRRQTSGTQSNLESMLQKMEKFDNCERIFSKQQFEDEYLRELTKQRKQPRAKR